jgi:hypothetical protein
VEDRDFFGDFRRSAIRTKSSRYVDIVVKRSATVAKLWLAPSTNRNAATRVVLAPEMVARRAAGVHARENVWVLGDQIAIGASRNEPREQNRRGRRLLPKNGTVARLYRTAPAKHRHETRPSCPREPGQEI